MHTTERTTVGPARKAHHKPDGTGLPVRDGQERKDCGAKRCRNSFLSTALAPIAPESVCVEIYENCNSGEVNVITRENYEFLRDSYFNYALLLQMAAEHTPGNSIGESIGRLYDEMYALVDDSLNVNIEHEKGRLFFRLWKHHQWGEFTLYYFPVKFLESLNPVLRKIAVTFINRLMKANGISTFLEDEESDFMFEMLSEDEGTDSRERKRQLKLLESYQNGKINRLLKRVETKSYYRNLPKAIESYVPQNGFERQLIGVMKRGLPFLTPEKGIMQYGYDAFYTENPDFHPMYLEQQIRIVYDINDVVTEYLVDYYNSYSRETYDIVPITVLDLSPDTEEVFRMDDYPENFFKWAEEFINIIC